VQSQSSTPVVLVNQSFARFFFSNQDPIGKHFGIVSPKNSGALEIVGVFADFKMNDPHHDVSPLFLRLLTQQYLGYTDPEAISSEKNSMFVGSIIVQFSRPQNDVENLLRHAMAEIDPNLTIFYFSSYDWRDLVLRDPPHHRNRIRMAMGASRSGIVSMVMRGALSSILIGIGLGIPAALYVGHLSASMLYGVRSNSPLAYLSATVALTISAAVAGFFPARRAASIDPMHALREE
jgi:FtsX-like permease family protein